jgi:hypothetical protein
MEKKLTALDFAERQATAEINFLHTAIEGKFKWVESDVAGMRRDIAKGALYPSTNLTKMAADVDQFYTRLKYATDWLENIKALRTEQEKEASGE